jgi:hypothetical protein
MYEDGTDAPSGNLVLYLGDLIYRLTAESAAEVAKEDKQNWRLIEQVEQGATGLCTVLAEKVCEL